MPQGRTTSTRRYRANEFVLVIDGTQSPGVSKVSGLSEGELDTIEQPDGGTDHVYKISGDEGQVRAADDRAPGRRQPGGQALPGLVRADVQAQRADARAARRAQERHDHQAPRRRGRAAVRLLRRLGQVVEVHRPRGRLHQPLHADHRARARGPRARRLSRRAMNPTTMSSPPRD